MAENDIYNSKRQYETIIRKIEGGIYLQPDKTTHYFIRNKENVKYFKQLINEFEFRDISYIRRIQIIKALRKTCFCTDKNLKDLTREDVKGIISELYSAHKTLATRRDFVNYNKAIWKIILPEIDNNGRPDDTVVPYPWRIAIHADKSLQRDKIDKISSSEYDKIQNSLNKDPRIQLYFALMYECLARPQELCYVNLADVDVYDNYARIRIKEHGKEGTKTLQVIDSYYYLVEWLNRHPKKDDKTKPLFITMSNNNRYERLTPKHANKILRRKLKEIGINKPITNYSFKRNGVTVRYLSGESAQNIQKIAGWTSTEQLRTYDLSEQEDFFKEELIKKGILKVADKDKNRFVTYKICSFCNSINPRANDMCSHCKRPLNRERILKEEANKEKEIQDLKEQVAYIMKLTKSIDLDQKIVSSKNG